MLCFVLILEEGMPARVHRDLLVNVVATDAGNDIKGEAGESGSKGETIKFVSTLWEV